MNYDRMYGGAQTDPSTLHLYAYCANNPINFIDPSGHSRHSKHFYHRYTPTGWHTTMGNTLVFAAWRIDVDVDINYNVKEGKSKNGKIENIFFFLSSPYKAHIHGIGQLSGNVRIKLDSNKWSKRVALNKMKEQQVIHNGSVYYFFHKNYIPKKKSFCQKAKIQLSLGFYARDTIMNNPVDTTTFTIKNK